MSVSTKSYEPIIVVVGGVAGGASAAARARRMNEKARIIMYEKDDYVSFANCGLPYYIGGEIKDRAKLLVATPQRFLGFFNIEVHTHHEVTDIDRERKVVKIHASIDDTYIEQPYDKLILAPGAEPIHLPINGMDAPNVFTLRSIPDADRIKSYIDQAQPKNVVVIGAGYIGLEMVEMLHLRGLKVSLVELQNQIIPPFDTEMAHLVQKELERHEVDIHLGTALKELEIIEAGVLANREKSLECDTITMHEGLVQRVVLDNAQTIDTDMVIIGIGVRPKTGLAKKADLALGQTGGITVDKYMRTNDLDIYAVGDVCEYDFQPANERMRVPLAGPANRAGRVAGEHAATVSESAPVMPSVLGTSIVRAFDVTAAATGVNEKLATRFNMDYHAVWVNAGHHVGYYPGAEEMMIKLLFENKTGKILGAQAVGGKGIDKRIDIIATLIQLGGTVDDLTALDLCYAPPFGGARDPLHQLGFVAQNHMRQLDTMHKPASTIDPDPDIQWLDVRNPDEWEAGHLPNALWIPLPQLRKRLSELNKGKPVVTICRGGQRSYYATRILKQEGFNNVGTLSGGMLMQKHI